MSTNTNTNQETGKLESILKGMVPALISMHEQNNPKAISKDFALALHIKENVYTSWTTWIHLMHIEVAPWVEKFNSKDATEDELKAVYSKLWPIWRQICRVGGDSKAHKHMFIREDDIVRICGFAVKHGKTAKGSVDVRNGEKVFRKEIETMLGIRLAQNAVLSEEDYKTIQQYESAIKNLDKAEDRLNGYVRNGQVVKGLREKLTEVEKTYNDMKSLVIPKGDNTPEDQIIAKYPILTGYKATVEDLKGNIKAQETIITNANATIAKLKSSYAEITGKLKEIEK